MRRSAPDTAPARSGALLAALGLCAACALPDTAPAPRRPTLPDVPVAKLELDGAVWFSYRLVSKSDFQAGSSHKLWGNFAHRAEICTRIAPLRGTHGYRAVMNPECSFWNKAIVPAKKAAAVAAVVLRSPVGLMPTSLPDWYVLQHEQIHFAINEVAARRLGRLAERLAARVDGDPSAGVERLYRAAVAQARLRHAEFDGETSGKFDADALEKWVRVLEHQLAELCADEGACRVRNDAE